MEGSAGERDFILEYTRSQLVKWANHLVTEGCLPDKVPSLYLEVALSKGWLTKKEPRRLTAKGFKAAAAFLRR
jgi:hypothetical protein